MADDATHIIGNIFDRASEDQQLRFVAEPLKALWVDGRWTATAIGAELEAIEETVLSETAS